MSTSASARSSNSSSEPAVVILCSNRFRASGLMSKPATGRPKSGFDRSKRVYGERGRVLVDGSEVKLCSVEDAKTHGIETVYQDHALIPQLPVHLNLFLNHEITRFGPLRLLDTRRMRELSRQYLDEIKVRVPSIDAEAEQPSGGQRQAVAVARSMRAATRILVLDKPLAAMGARESRLVIDLVKDLASTGRVSIIVIDHNYAHLFELCNRINVMQGGRITIDQPVHETSLEQMVSSYRVARAFALIRCYGELPIHACDGPSDRKPTSTSDAPRDRRGDQRPPSATPPRLAALSLAAAPGARDGQGSSGSERRQQPVAEWSAFASAGATATIGVSPAPADGMSRRSMSSTSSAGTSVKRGTR